MSVLALTLTVGTLAGMVAGYFGGWLDTVLMRGADIVFAFPELILAILVAAMLGPGTPTVVVALAIVWWPGIARLTRSLTLSLRTELFVDAAVVSATRPMRHPPSPRPAQHPAAAHRPGFHRGRLHRDGGGDLELPRHRRPGAPADAGAG